MSAFEERLASLSPAQRELLELFVRKERELTPDGDVEPPLEGSEMALARVFCEVLNLPRVGRHEDFFELGGDSILTLQAVASAEQEGLRISVQDLFRNPTVAALACVARELVEASPAARTATGAELVEALGDALVDDVYPLTPMQEAILFETLRARGAPPYQLQWSFEVRGEFEWTAFESAWRRAVARHPVLRTAIRWVGRDEPAQVVLQSAPALVRYEDWRALTPDAQQAAFSRACAEDRERPFELERPPLARVAVLRISERVYRVIWSHHHLVLDGWSQHLLVREMAVDYEALRRGVEPSPAVAPRFKRYVQWVASAQDEHVLRAFWRRTLAPVRARARVREPASAERSSAASACAELHFEAETTEAL